MPPKHHPTVKHTLTRRLTDASRNPANWFKGGVGLLMLTLFLTWVMPKMLDSSWGRLCTLKEEADQVPQLVLTVSNLNLTLGNEFELENHLRWQVYNLSNRVVALEARH